MTEGQESERRIEEFRSASAMFMEALNVDDVIAHLLVTEGFADVEAVAFVPIEELVEIEGFGDTLGEELRQRAQQHLIERDERFSVERQELGVADDLAAIEPLTPAMLVALGKSEIKTLDDLGDLASDELVEIVGGDTLPAEDADQIIMAARAHWFADEDAAVENAPPTEPTEEAGPTGQPNDSPIA